jgi:hypothetical protein
MTFLYGQQLSRRQVAERSGALAQFAGVRLMILDDGVERGVRMLDFRTGSGLHFTVMVDRGFDIGDCEHKGRSIGWHSPSGFRHPGLSNPEDEDGLGWLRSASGLLVTCGLDHMLGGSRFPADHYHYGPRPQVRAPLHGRVSMIPARLTGYGECWEGDDCILWAEGVVQQAAIFGEDLHLIRRIEASVGGDEVRITDRVINHGFYRTPHMYLYHINVGFPLLDIGARYLAPIRDVVWAAHAGEAYERQGVGYRRMPPPSENFHEQVWQHEMAADAAGQVSVGLVNDCLGFGLEVQTRAAQFPAYYQWQNFQAGHYVLGIEPSTNHVLGRSFAEERDELIWLEHGEERRYDTTLRLLDGAAAVADAERRIRAIGPQPEDDFPAPSGRYLPITR